VGQKWGALHAGVPGQGTWETTLEPRDLDGDLATAETWCDTARNITWLGNTDVIVASN
jgi:hypothetical protein